MEKYDRFNALLEQLTQQLRGEHRCEVDGLKAEVEGLREELARCEKLLAGPGREPPPGDAPAGAQARCPAAAVVGHCALEPGDVELEVNAKSKWTGATRAAAVAKLKKYVHRADAQQKPLAFTASTRRPARALSSNPALAFVERMVHSELFDVFFSFLIALNAIIMAVEAEFKSSVVAAELGFSPGGSSSPSEVAATVEAYDVVSKAFGVFFTIEIILRITALRAKFVRDLWNWMDLFLVLLWLIAPWESVILFVNPMILRLARLAKLFRLIRLVRKIQQFDPLFLMTTAIKSSLSILGWTCCLLFVILLLMALLLHAILTEFYLKNTALPFSERLVIYEYFGSFTSSLFSMFELTLANWPPISRALYQNVSEWFKFIAIFHKLAFGFALVGIINGVFIQETFKAAQQDDEVMIRRARFASRVHKQKMGELMTTVDESGDRHLTIEEFRKIVLDPGLKSWMASMELSPSDVDALFHIMADGAGTLNVEKLSEGVAKFKGTARTIDLHMLWKEHRQLMQEQRHLQATVETHLLPPRRRQNSQGGEKNRPVHCFPFIS